MLERLGRGVIPLNRLWANEPPVTSYVAERESLNKLEISHGKKRKGREKGQLLREEKRTPMSGQGRAGPRGRAEPPLPPSPGMAGPGRDKAGRGTARWGRAGPGGAGRAARPPRAVPSARCPLPALPRGHPPASPSLSPGRLPPQRWLPAAEWGAGVERGAGAAVGLGEEMAAAAAAAAAAARRPPGLLSRSRSSQPTAPMTAQAARSSQHGHRPQPAPHSASQPPAAPTHRSMPGPGPPAARRLRPLALGDGTSAASRPPPPPPRARPAPAPDSGSARR